MQSPQKEVVSGKSQEAVAEAVVTAATGNDDSKIHDGEPKESEEKHNVEVEAKTGSVADIIDQGASNSSSDANSDGHDDNAGKKEDDGNSPKALHNNEDSDDSDDENVFLPTIKDGSVSDESDDDNDNNAAASTTSQSVQEGESKDAPAATDANALPEPSASKTSADTTHDTTDSNDDKNNNESSRMSKNNDNNNNNDTKNNDDEIKNNTSAEAAIGDITKRASEFNMDATGENNADNFTDTSTISAQISTEKKIPPTATCAVTAVAKVTAPIVNTNPNTIPASNTSVPSTRVLAAAVNGPAKISGSSVSTNFNFVTMTKEELEELKATIIKETREKTLQRAHQEMEIISNDHAHLQASYDVCMKENLELKATLDEVMESFEKHIQQTKSDKSDQLAYIGIIETEQQQLREKASKTDEEHEQLTIDFHSLKRQYGEVKLSDDTHKKKATQLETELRKSRDDCELITNHAQEKLNQAADEYRKVVRKEGEKDALLSQIQTELKKLKQRTDTAEARYEESTHEIKRLEQEAAQLDSHLQEKSLESAKLSSNLNSTISELQSVQLRLEEVSALNVRYKEQIVGAREQMRQMHTQRTSQELAEAKLAQQSEEVEKLNEQNRVLKSRLFDNNQVIAELKKQVQDGAAADSGDADIVAHLRQELEKKENENKELMIMCDELVREVEASKGQ